MLKPKPVPMTLGVACHGFVRFAEARDMKGVERDRAAEIFFAGLALALAIAEHKDATAAAKFALTVVKLGYSHVRAVTKAQP